MKRDPTQKAKYQMKNPPDFQNYFKKLSQQKNKWQVKKAEPVVPKTKQKQRGRPVTRLFSQQVQGHINNLVRNINVDRKKSAVQSAASSRQYAMYLNDTKNVFYQDRPELKSIQFYLLIRPMLSLVFFCLFLTWLGLFFVEQYPGVCPDHAECGVYIHCFYGYELIGKQCVVTKQTKESAVQYCLAAIQNLKYEYGSKDCSDKKSAYTPSKDIDTLFEDYQIFESAVKGQIRRWLQSYDNQDKHYFIYRAGVITPTQKKYDIFCRFQLLVSTEWFYFYVILAVIIFFVVIIWIKVHHEKQRAYKIYEFLKAKLKKNKGDITIEIHELQKNFGSISYKLWKNIDQARVQDRCITFYEDRELHWKLI